MEGGAEVVGHVVVEVKTSEAVILDVADAVVVDGESEGLSGGDAGGGYVHEVIVVGAAAFDEHGVSGAFKV